jgi:hypothetical protein
VLDETVLHRQIGAFDIASGDGLPDTLLTETVEDHTRLLYATPRTVGTDANRQRPDVVAIHRGHQARRV